MGNIVYTLTNRRYGEKCIAYAESHDQVGYIPPDCLLWIITSVQYVSPNLNQIKNIFAGSGRG